MTQAMSSGEKISSSKRFRRLAGAMPSTHTFFQYLASGEYYAECNVPGGDEYSANDPVDVLNNVMADANCRRLHIKKGTHELDNTITAKSNLEISLDPTAELKATANMTRLFDARDLERVFLVGGKFQGGGYATTVLDFSTPSGNSVTNHAVCDIEVWGARNIAGSKLLDISKNSNFQMHGNCILNGATAWPGSASARYGIYCGQTGGENTLYLGSINGCKTANIYFGGGGVLKVYGGSLNGGGTNLQLSKANIEIKADVASAEVIMDGVWMENNAVGNPVTENSTPNILIEDVGALDVRYVKVKDCMLSAVGVPNIKGEHTGGGANQVVDHLHIVGGDLLGFDGVGGTPADYHIDCPALEVKLDAFVWGGSTALLNATNVTYLTKLGMDGYGVYAKGMDIKVESPQSAYLHDVYLSKQAVFRMKDFTDQYNANIFYIGDDNRLQFQLWGMSAQYAGKMIVATDCYFTYDYVNSRYLFYINNVCVGYVDATGFHNGAPP